MNQVSQNMGGRHRAIAKAQTMGRELLVGFLALAAFLAATRSLAQTSVDYTKISPADLVAKTPKGKLRNPYKDTQAAVVTQGSALFVSYSCSGCHGGSGGGGICPPLTDGVWIYGGDDDTLFRLVTLGSDALQKQGYTRTGLENVVAPMPAFGSVIKNADDLWKILAFVRSKYDGPPGTKYGAPPAGQ
jgi:mono/diheme cytochrome c family protein